MRKAKDKVERFQMTFTEEQLHFLRLYMVKHSINGVQDAVRHIVTSQMEALLKKGKGVKL